MRFSGTTIKNTQLKTGTVIVRTGLVYYIDFGNSASYSGSGSAVHDLSGSGLGDATLYNDPTYSNGAVTFNGSNQYAFTPDMATPFSTAGTGAYTLEVWISAPTDNGCILVEEGHPSLDGGWYDSVMEIVSGTLYTSHWNGGQQSTNAGTFPRSQWNQCVATYDGTTIRTYINGVAGGTRTAGRQPPWAYGYPYYLSMMGFTRTTLGDGSYLAGSLGQLRVYTQALSDTEVAQNFTAMRGRYGI